MTKVVFGYKADGDARLFQLEDGAVLPSGWSFDINVIEDPARRTGEAISAAAGGANAVPITVTAPAVKVKGSSSSVFDVNAVVPPSTPPPKQPVFDRAAHMQKMRAARRAGNGLRKEN